jgi:hypothetical protein
MIHCCLMEQTKLYQYVINIILFAAIQNFAKRGFAAIGTGLTANYLFLKTDTQQEKQKIAPKAVVDR